MIASQALTTLMTIYIANRIVGLNISKFLFFTIKAIISFIAVYSISLYVKMAIVSVYSEWLSFIIIVPISMFSFAAVYYLFVFDHKDKERVVNVTNALIKKK